MITTIIITALVSVFLTLVIGYFIWQFISVRKLKKQVKDNSNTILGQSEWIKILDDNTTTRFDEVYQTIGKNEEETNKKIIDNWSETHKKINKNYEDIWHANFTSNPYLSKNVDEISNTINNNDEEIHRELDRRFDKVYKNLEDLENKIAFNLNKKKE
jgi:gas vesicle protein